jgi:GH24 family phage-related lysozyme (muramidase)
MAASTADDQVRLLVSIEATQKQFAKQLAAVAKSAGDTATGVENRFKKANDNVGKSFQDGGRKTVQSLGAQRAAVSNLSFQLNDIAMGLASGTSPFTIMVQQGSQVSQALQGSGGLVGAVKTLGGAFATMVNPVSLASFAIIGLGGALVQYLTTLGSGVPDSDTLLKEHGELIKSFDAAWGIAEEGVKKYSDATRQVELQKLRDEFDDLSKVAADAYDDVTHGIRQISASDFGSGALIDQTLKAMTLLDQEVPALREFAAEMVKIENADGVPATVREAATEARKLAQELFPVQDALEQTQGKLNKIRLSGDEAKVAVAALTSAALGLGTTGTGAIGSIASKITTDLIPAMTNAITQVGELIKNYGTLQEQVNKTTLGQLSPVFSGGGQFLNEDQNNTFKAGEANFEAAGKSAAADMIRGFESFISSAKWDVNAYRTGYGSDTTTRMDGTIEKVTKDTVVSLADAERDLSRRLIEFQSGIQKAIGIDTWNSLNQAQQAALSSIAYNYGSLPKSIVAAIESGGGPEAVAKAIAGLTANPGRRKEEAQSYLSGTGYSMANAGLGSAKKSPADLFKGDLAQVEKRIALMNAEYAAQAQLNPLVTDYGYAVEKARIEQQLLSEAQAAGLTVTPELAATIGTLAENYARASSASDQLKASQQQAAESAKAFGDLGKEVVGGFISDLRSGKSAAEAFAGALDRIADKLINLAIDGLFGGFGGGGGAGGLFGGAIIPGILHKGGVAGSDGYSHGRSVAPSAFAGATRYHTGGVAGLMPGEVPAILQRGEVVLPRGTKSGGGSNVHVTVGVSADNNGNLLPFVESVSQQTVTTAAPKIVSAANQQVVPTMAKYQSQKAGGEWR